MQKPSGGETKSVLENVHARGGIEAGSEKRHFQA
jgi:hypothetical protein